MIKVSLDPNKVFRLAKEWFLTSDIPPQEIVDRISTIIAAFEDARDKFLPANQRSAHVFKGKSTDARIEEWTKPQKYRLYQRIDLEEMIQTTTFPPVWPAYSVHPAKKIGADQGTPSYENTKRIDLTKRPDTVPVLRGSATSYFQNAKEFRNRFGLSKEILVRGVGTTVTSKEKDREKIRVLQKRIEDLRRKETIGAPGLFSEPFPVITNQYSSRGLELWPQAFLEERIERWKNVFFGWIFNWYTDTKDAFTQHLKENGWLDSGPAGGAAANVTKSGNDVRFNAIRLFSEMSLNPLVRKTQEILERNFDFLELSLMREEVMDLVFQALEAEEPGAEKITVARGAWAKNILKIHPPPELESFYKTYLELRGRTLETHPPPEWMKGGRAESLPSMKNVLKLFEGYLYAKLTSSIDEEVKQILAEDIVGTFLAQQLDARVLTEVAAAGAEIRRVSDYLEPQTDPSYDLLIRLAAYPHPTLVREMRELDIREKKFALFPGRDEETRTYSDDVKSLNLFYYTRPFSRKFGQEGDAEPFLFWMNRMKISLPRGFAGAISKDERADINEYAIQNARFELLRALETAIKEKEVDKIIEVRLGNKSSIELRPRVPVWPPGTSEATFELRLTQESKELSIKKVPIPHPIEGQEQEFSLGEWPEAGLYVVRVQALNDQKAEVGEGFSVKIMVKRLARCARCRGDFDLEMLEHKEFSKDCTWKSQFPLKQKLPRIRLVDWLVLEYGPRNPAITYESQEKFLRRYPYNRGLTELEKNAKNDIQIEIMGVFRKKYEKLKGEMILTKEKERREMAPTTRAKVDRRMFRPSTEDDFQFDKATLSEIKNTLKSWGIDASEIDLYDGREQELTKAEWEFMGAHSIANPFPDPVDLIGSKNLYPQCDIELEGICKDYESLYKGLFKPNRAGLRDNAKVTLKFGSFRSSREPEQDSLAKEIQEKVITLNDNITQTLGNVPDWTLRRDFEEVVKLIGEFNKMTFGESYTGI
jgi:hypothetical protein